jgi:hypothetical protein
MRTVVLCLPDDQFTELYALSKGFLVSNRDESPFADMMHTVHDQCDKHATDDERDFLNVQINKMAHVFTEDSPERDLARAGLNELLEKANETL